MVLDCIIVLPILNVRGVFASPLLEVCTYVGENPQRNVLLKNQLTVPLISFVEIVIGSLINLNFATKSNKYLHLYLIIIYRK